MAIEWTTRRKAMASAVALLATFTLAGDASAQRVPDAASTEGILKRALMTFNDANVTGNYTVMHARAARQLQAKFTPEQLKAAFKSFQDQKIDIAPIMALPPVYSTLPKIDNDGALALDGQFETRPSRVKFSLRLLPAEGDWKVLGINVNVSAAEPDKALPTNQKK